MLFTGAANKQCLLFRKHMFVLAVLFSVWFLNEHAQVCVWVCLMFGPRYVVFGVRFRCCVLFGVRASSSQSPVLMIMSDHRISWSSIVIRHDGQIWSSYIITLCGHCMWLSYTSISYYYPIWWSHVMIAYDRHIVIMYGDHIRRSHMKIIHDGHICSSYTIIICDHHIWCSHMVTRCDDHIWWSHLSIIMIVVHDHHIWLSFECHIWLSWTCAHVVFMFVFRCGVCLCSCLCSPEQMLRSYPCSLTRLA